MYLTYNEYKTLGGKLEEPEFTANVDATGTLRILEAVRMLNLNKKTRIYGD